MGSCHCTMFLILGLELGVILGVYVLKRMRVSYEFYDVKCLVNIFSKIILSLLWIGEIYLLQS